MAERTEAEIAKRRFASKMNISNIFVLVSLLGKFQVENILVKLPARVIIYKK